MQEFADEIKRHFDVSAEALRSEIRQVADGFRSLDEKVARGFEDVAREFDEVKAMIKFSHAELARRLDTHDHELADLRERVERLEREAS
jgi:predicted nuclease with TOPRIM domain